MRKSMPFIYAALLAALSLVSCQKEEMLPESDFQDSPYDELITKASAVEQVPITDPVFSVSPTKKVFFTKGNLYWDGNDWKFESSQTDYPREWSQSHVSHFYWTKTAAAAYAEKYSENTSMGDRFFADGSDSDHMLTIEGQSDLYALSMYEWFYLLSGAPEGRGAGDSYFKNGVTVNGVAHCLVIAPDGYTGKIASSYDAASWADAEASGLVCLPPANYREGASLSLRYERPIGEYLSTTLSGFEHGGGLVEYLRFDGGGVTPYIGGRLTGHLVRLVSTVPVPTSTAKATIGGKEVDVEWVQLWRGGPKFAVKNVGADVCRDKGSKMTYAAAVKTGKDYVWGSNWRTPAKKEMGLLNDPRKVKCEFCQVGGRYGFKFTGVQRGYTGSSLFFPADYGIPDYSRWAVGRASYWSSTTAPGFGKAWAFRLFYMRGKCTNSWGATDKSDKLYVRPVLNE